MIGEILDMVRLLGALVGVLDPADALTDRLAANVERTRRRAMAAGTRPRVSFEEWDEPMISVIAWVSEPIEAAGGDNVFADLAKCRGARDHIVSAGEVIDRAGHHRGFVVRQEVQPGAGRGAAGTRGHSRGPRRPSARDQVAADPAASDRPP